MAVIRLWGVAVRAIAYRIAYIIAYRISYIFSHTAAHRTHVGDLQGAGVDEGGFVLRVAGGADGAAELRADALRPQQAEGFQGVDAGLKLLIGAELGGILLHIGAIMALTESIMSEK